MSSDGQGAGYEAYIHSAGAQGRKPWDHRSREHIGSQERAATDLPSLRKAVSIPGCAVSQLT